MVPAPLLAIHMTMQEPRQLKNEWTTGGREGNALSPVQRHIVELQGAFCIALDHME